MKKFRFLDDEQLHTLPPPEPLIQDFIHTKALAFLVGEPGAGKTFVTLDWLMSVQVGRPWLGRHKVKQGNALMVLSEGTSGLKKRVEAWKSYHGYEEKLGINFVTEPVNMLDAPTVDDFVRQVKDRIEDVSIVAVDTLARAMVGGDENSALDSGVFIENINHMQRELRCAVVVVHHTTKDGRSERGSSAFRGAADAMFILNKNEVGLGANLFTSKQKDDAPAPKVKLDLLKHDGSLIVEKASAVLKTA